jgi:DNA-binding response OmpR family regulator
MDKPHILIVEDDASVCELLCACLKKAERAGCVSRNASRSMDE